MTTLTTPKPEIPREERFGRPLVVPKGGGKRVPYTRATTYVGCIEDTFKLGQWQQRLVATGLADRPDLLLSVAAHRDDKDTMNNICDDAREFAKASAAATTGTALHTLTELVDRGIDLPVLPADAVAGLDAYRAATVDLKAIHIEQFCVLDNLKIGGTPDRVVEYQGKRYIADVKTGTVEWGTLKIAAQLAVYARSRTYDVTTNERGMHGADLERGIIIHLPAGQARCDLIWVDLLAGWRAVMVAKDVRAQRTADRFKKLTRPWSDTDGFDDMADITIDGMTRVAPASTVSRAGVVRTPAEQVAQADSRAELEALWTAYTRDGLWTDELTAAAAKRTTELQKVAS